MSRETLHTRDDEKILVTRENPQFKPVTVKITLLNIDELKSFTEVIDNWDNDIAKALRRAL